MSVNDHLKELGITLPSVPGPAGNYVDAVHTGNLLYLSGKGPLKTEGGATTGKLGKDVTLEQGYQDARSVGLIMLAVLQKELGDLDRVKRVVKLLGMVNAVPECSCSPSRPWLCVPAPSSAISRSRNPAEVSTSFDWGSETFFSQRS